MKRAEDLSVPELRRVARELQEFFYWDNELQLWDARHEVSETDLRELVGELLHGLDMVPEPTGTTGVSLREMGGDER